MEFTEEIEDLIKFVAYYSMRETFEVCAGCFEDCIDVSRCNNDEMINEIVVEYYKSRVNDN